MKTLGWGGSPAGVVANRANEHRGDGRDGDSRKAAHAVAAIGGHHEREERLCLHLAEVGREQCPP